MEFYTQIQKKKKENRCAVFLRTVVQEHGHWRGKEIPRLAEMLFSVSLFAFYIHTFDL